MTLESFLQGLFDGVFFLFMFIGAGVSLWWLREKLLWWRHVKKFPARHFVAVDWGRKDGDMTAAICGHVDQHGRVYMDDVKTWKA